MNTTFYGDVINDYLFEEVNELEPLDIDLAKEHNWSSSEDEIDNLFETIYQNINEIDEALLNIGITNVSGLELSSDNEREPFNYNFNAFFEDNDSLLEFKTSTPIISIQSSPKFILNLNGEFVEESDNSIIER